MQAARDVDRDDLARDERGERATRDIVSRAMVEQIRAGNTSPLGGLYLQRYRFNLTLRRELNAWSDLFGNQLQRVEPR